MNTSYAILNRHLLHLPLFISLDCQTGEFLANPMKRYGLAQILHNKIGNCDNSHIK
jgi:hypothetical protein